MNNLKCIEKEQFYIRCLYRNYFCKKILFADCDIVHFVILAFKYLNKIYFLS